MKKLPPLEEFILFTVGRMDLREEWLESWLTGLGSGCRIALLDRDHFSSLCYQGAGRGLDLNFIYWVNESALGYIRPDLRLVLGVDVEDGLERATSDYEEPDKIGGEKIKFHKRVNDCYFELSKGFANTVYVPSAVIGEVYKNVEEEVFKILE